ncbi:fibronectin type III domain-containing protein [Marinicella meishanensis]|uniref:fibronectin type III domain-containing protein n=1 Tax=Marinicella meishanensis TaxID=2873263 RepID=UPI001CBAC694|nr:fibronectin type III domain-containing protein [Marinicella sp. NBU2979]
MKISGILLLAFATGLAQAAIPQNQRDALVTLYESTQGDQWHENLNWLNGDPCDDQWFGLICSNNKLVELRLSGNNLSGEIPPAIGELTDLTLLAMGENPLRGTIPDEIGNLSNLFNIFLHDTQISGRIPDSIGNLGLLRALYLYNNQLSGNIPTAISQIAGLNILVLTSNQLTGELPTSLINLEQLVIFLYEHNGLYATDTALFDFLFRTSCFNNGVFVDCPSLNTQTQAPTDFRIESSTETSVELAWDSVEYGELGGYQIWLGATANGPFSLVHDTLSKGQLSHTVTGLPADTEHHFRLTSYTNPHTLNKNRIVSPATDLAGDRSTQLSHPMSSVHSGSWFNADQSGHGLVVQILSADSAVVYWYVYDDAGNQLWLVGTGPYDGHSIQVDMFESSGAMFPPDFDSSDVNTTYWGSLNITITSDNTLSYHWVPKQGSELSPGALNLEQLSRITAGAGDSGNRALDGSHSGSWFNAQESGHGLAVEVLPSGVGLIYWYVYDQNGNPIWLIGSGAIEGDTINVEFFIYSGAMFPPAFDTDDLVQTFWGSGSLTLNGCNAADFSWQPDDAISGFTAGQMELQRLTALADLACSD